MATFGALMARTKRGTAYLDRGRGLGGFVFDKGERYGGSAFFGWLKTAHPEHRMIWKLPTDVFAGALLTLAAAGLEIHAGASGRRSKIAPHLNALGDAGVMAFFHSLGAGHGAKSNLPALPSGGNPALPAQNVNGSHILGAIDPAVGGAYLSDAQLQHYRSPR